MLIDTCQISRSLLENYLNNVDPCRLDHILPYNVIGSGQLLVGYSDFVYCNYLIIFTQYQVDRHCISILHELRLALSMVYESEIKISMILNQDKAKCSFHGSCLKERIFYAVQKIYSLLYYFFHFVFHITGKYRCMIQQKIK